MNGHAILIAEDDAADIFHAQRIFFEANILNPVKIVRNGQKAIDYLKGVGIYADRELYPYPGLLLLDLRMPVKTGLEVLEWLHTQPKPHPRVVMLTNVRDIQEMNNAYQLGADTFLTKPLLLEDLINLIERLPGIRVVKDNKRRDLQFV